MSEYTSEFQLLRTLSYQDKMYAMHPWCNSKLWGYVRKQIVCWSEDWIMGLPTRIKRRLATWQLSVLSGSINSLWQTNPGSSFTVCKWQLYRLDHFTDCRVSLRI